MIMVIRTTGRTSLSSTGFAVLGTGQMPHGACMALELTDKFNSQGEDGAQCKKASYKASLQDLPH